MAYQEKYYDSLPDQECWALLQDGCEKSLEVLYFRYYDQLYHYAVGFCGKRELAEDHIQSLFLKIWERRNQLGKVKHVKTYLWVSLRRSLMAEQEAASRFSESGVDLENYDFRIISSAEEIILLKEKEREILNDLYEALHNLNPRQKEILYLKFFEGMSYQEIQDITSLKYQSVRNYIYESVKILKSTLQEKNGHSKPLNMPIMSGLFMLLSASV